VVWHFRRNTVGAYINQQRGYGKAEALVYAKHPFRFNLFGQAKWLGRIYGDLSAALLLSRKPVIYSGVFGRGLFQTMYEPPSSLTALLPLTFEWSVAALVLALIGIVVGGWLWLLLVPLLATWAMCVNGALKAPIDPRFTGLKARALVALLIYLGPLLRGWELSDVSFYTTELPQYLLLELARGLTPDVVHVMFEGRIARTGKLDGVSGKFNGRCGVGSEQARCGRNVGAVH